MVSASSDSTISQRRPRKPAKAQYRFTITSIKKRTIKEFTLRIVRYHPKKELLKLRTCSKKYRNLASQHPATNCGGNYTFHLCPLLYKIPDVKKKSYYITFPSLNPTKKGKGKKKKKKKKKNKKRKKT